MSVNPLRKRRLRVRPLRYRLASTRTRRRTRACRRRATVGMCLKEACSICGQLGTDPFSPEYYRQVHEIASDLIRVALHLEAGKLAPSAKDRQPKE